jgi:hypothetical protein
MSAHSDVCLPNPLWASGGIPMVMELPVWVFPTFFRLTLVVNVHYFPFNFLFLSKDHTLFG